VQIQRNARDALVDEEMRASRPSGVRKMPLASRRIARGAGAAGLKAADPALPRRREEALPAGAGAVHAGVPLATRLGIWQIKWELRTCHSGF
jgi:GTP pyrophosphokinase